VILTEAGLDYVLIGSTVAISLTAKASEEIPTKIEKYTISGHIYDKTNRETLIGASVYDPTNSLGTISNEYGFYSLTLPEGSYDISYSYLGFTKEIINVDLTQNATIDVELEEMGMSLDEVVITAANEKVKEYTSSTEIGTIDVSIDEVKSMPALLGEVDVIKTVQLLPGVSSGTEGSSGFSVRGGNLDQNLVILDDAPVYSPSHVLGFFSAFNPDAIKDMKLYKGDLPARYGGRLASVLDIRMKDGNAKNLSMSGGIGTTMSRLTLETPINKNGSIMVAGRRSYIDVLARGYNSLTNNSLEIDGDAFYFYDLNLKGNYRLDKNNRLYLSGYFGRDVLDINDDDGSYGFTFGNATSTLRWNHIFSPKMFSNFTYYFSDYTYQLKSDKGGESLGNSEAIGFDWTSHLKEHGLTMDMGIYINPNNTLHFGATTILRNLDPGELEILNNSSTTDRSQLQKYKSLESAIYINNEQTISERLKLDYGVRFSMLQNIGPNTAVVLDENYMEVGNKEYQNGIYNYFLNMEPRLKLRYQLTSSSSLKASYSRSNQYIQQAAVGNFSTPFDIWFTSTPQIEPQSSNQFSVGYFKTVDRAGLALSAEVYHRDVNGTIDFKDNPDLILNDNLQAELRTGIARSTGLELMVKKSTGPVNGWVSYTLSRSQKMIETINNDDWFNTRFDKPHNLSMVANYNLNQRIKLASNFIYSTGTPVTLPNGRYEFENTSIPIYSDRNGTRLPDYHRLDLSISIQGKNNKSRKIQTEWVIGIYNIYNRRNAFIIIPERDNSNPNVHIATQRAIFGILPSFTFNAKF
jgi:hypothetical protein